MKVMKIHCTENLRRKHNGQYSVLYLKKNQIFGVDRICFSFVLQQLIENERVPIKKFKDASTISISDKRQEWSKWHYIYTGSYMRN